MSRSPSCYRSAVSSVRTELTAGDIRTNDSILWSTFFLGMFELMYDMSGEGWIKHILHGTSQLLRFRGPDRHITGAGRRFFLATRIFEISRAIIYSSETFLARAEWQSLMGHMWVGGGAKDWHPKEALYDLMISCSALGVRAMKTIRSPIEESNATTLQELADQGLVLQSALQSWAATALEWSSHRTGKEHDIQMELASIYHHAIQIYLSGTFDYHPHWHTRHIHTPTLAPTEIASHVTFILAMVSRALKSTNLAGLLFLFPLRVAGARVQTLEQKLDIARMLALVTERGFVVAQAFTEDLEGLWKSTAVVTGIE